jgi:Leucine-rich repeat (LRR) protein
MLLCDVEHERGNDKALNSVALADSSARERLSWSALRHLDLRSNRIRRVDVSLKLAPALATLKLGRNELSRIETNLSQMSQLTSLDLSSNLIEEISTEEVKDLNLFRLDVAGNRLRTLDALASVSTLASVDASANRIAELADIEEVCRLPAMVCLNLQGNKVTRIVDYRLKVLERFGQRCSELCLDSETPSQSEVDKVSVRMAMKVAKEGGDHTALFGNLPRRVATSSNH